MQEERKKFICTKCGACCRFVSYYEGSQFLDRGDGICKYLDETTNLCKIYDYRPEVCRVDKMYKKYKNQMTWDEYLAANYEACEQLREIEKAKKFRETYPDKKEYNDILSENEFKDIDIPEDKVVIKGENELNDEFFDVE